MSYQVPADIADEYFTDNTTLPAGEGSSGGAATLVQGAAAGGAAARSSQARMAGLGRCKATWNREFKLP